MDGRPNCRNKAAFSSSYGFEERFCDGLVWTVGLTVEIKLRFQVPRGLKSVFVTD